MKYQYKISSLIVMMDSSEILQKMESYPAGMIGCTNGLLVWVDFDVINTHPIQYMAVGGMAFYLQKFYTSVEMFNTGYGLHALPKYPVKFEDLRGGTAFFLVAYNWDEEVHNLLERIASPHYQEQVHMLVVAK